LGLDGIQTVYDQRFNDVAKLLVVLFNRKFSVDMFSRASQPIDYFQDERNFHSELCELAKESSQMPAGALRLWKDRTLETQFFWNDWVNRTFKNSDWDVDLDNKGTIEVFEKCLNGRKVITLGEADLEHGFFSQPMQNGVKSAVFCPINVGSEVIGVLSFAMPRRYDFSSIEKMGFLNLANSIGVSLTNFSQSASAQSILHDDVKISQILTAVEIAQAARHSARADLDTLKTYVLTATRLLDSNLDRGGKQKVKDVLESCDGSISSCFKSLDDIKSAIRPPARQREEVSLSSLLESAKSQIRGRSVKNNVNIEWIGKDQIVECYPDHLKQVFLNLLLNSVDAFSELKRQNNRNIRFRLHDLQENAHSIKIRVEDDAGGVDVAALRLSANDHEATVEELVFAKDITSKGKDGSGWGLYVSRKVVNDHGGHLTLIEYRNKSVFEITLLKRFAR